MDQPASPDEADYLRDNRANWDERAGLHVASPDYRVADFDDPGFLSDVVRFDQPRLGDVAGLRGIHLQCHIGTDTVSLSRLGAQMAGLDLSPESIRQAGLLSARLDARIDWLVADVYDAPDALRRAGLAADFDLVYVSVGALNWLPSVTRWAEVVSVLLRPGGRLFIRDVHPVLLAAQPPGPDGRLVLTDPYFEQSEASVYEEEASYVETAKPLTATRNHSWSHGIGELVTALLSAGMRLTGLIEHDTVPFAPFGELMSDVGGGEFRLIDRPERMPLSFTLQAVKD